jgi:hypothetical protein
MAKKLGKLAFLGVIAGAAAGTYYYFQNKNKKSEEAFDDLDDLDDFDDDLEDEDFSSEPKEGNTASKSHSHVSIDLDNAKEKIGGKVIETLDKTKEKLEQLNVSEKIDKAKEFIGDKISSPDSAPEYTEMDITSAQTADNAAKSEEESVKESTPATPKENAKVHNVSSTYSDDSDSSDSKGNDKTENFFSKE